MDGIVNINKSPGMTSSDVVQKVKRILGTRKVGHMGTLDPIGCGVLLVGIGKGARLFDYYLKKEKTYLAEFEFGYETDTLDNTGTTLATTKILPTIDEIRAVLPSFVGKQEQMPPKYSAKLINGVRAYELARKGLDVELKTSTIEIFGIQCLKQTKENTYLFEIDCSAGTYIRSICRDVAYALGSLASMTSIQRTKCGKFLVEDAVSLEDLSQSNVLKLEDVIDLARFDAPDDLFGLLCNGVRVKCDNAPDGQFVLFCKNELFGIARYDDGIKITTYLRSEK